MGVSLPPPTPPSHPPRSSRAWASAGNHLLCPAPPSQTCCYAAHLTLVVSLGTGRGHSLDQASSSRAARPEKKLIELQFVNWDQPVLLRRAKVAEFYRRPVLPSTRSLVCSAGSGFPPSSRPSPPFPSASCSFDPRRPRHLGKLSHFALASCFEKILRVP